MKYISTDTKKNNMELGSVWTMGTSGDKNDKKDKDSDKHYEKGYEKAFECASASHKGLVFFRSEEEELFSKKEFDGLDESLQNNNPIVLVK